MEKIHQCNIEGLAIAEALLFQAQRSVMPTTTPSDELTLSSTPVLSGKGGSWIYTIGLVGKPSAGKESFVSLICRESPGN